MYNKEHSFSLMRKGTDRRARPLWSKHGYLLKLHLDVISIDGIHGYSHHIQSCQFAISASSAHCLKVSNTAKFYNSRDGTILGRTSVQVKMLLYHWRPYKPANAHGSLGKALRDLQLCFDPIQAFKIAAVLGRILCLTAYSRPSQNLIMKGYSFEDEQNAIFNSPSHDC